MEIKIQTDYIWDTSYIAARISQHCKLTYHIICMYLNIVPPKKIIIDFLHSRGENLIPPTPVTPYLGFHGTELFCVILINKIIALNPWKTDTWLNGFYSIITSETQEFCVTWTSYRRWHYLISDMPRQQRCGYFSSALHR